MNFVLNEIYQNKDYWKKSIRIAVADGVVYRGTRNPKTRTFFFSRRQICGLIAVCGVSRFVEYIYTSEIGGLAFGEIASDKKGPESGLISYRLTYSLHRHSRARPFCCVFSHTFPATNPPAVLSISCIFKRL